MSFSSFMSLLFLHRCRRFSLKWEHFQSVRTFHKNKRVHIISWAEYLLNMHVKRRALRVESFVGPNFFYSRRRSRARFDENEWTFKAYKYKTLYMSDQAFCNVIYHYLNNDHYFVQFQTLFFTFSPRRRQRQRQQYEVFQKILCDTSLNNTKMILSITSIRNNRMFQFIDSSHSTFTFCLVFFSFWSRWRYSLYIWNQHLSKTWKIVDKWRFDRRSSSNEFHSAKLIDWWSIDDQKVDRKKNEKKVDERW